MEEDKTRVCKACGLEKPETPLHFRVRTKYVDNSTYRSICKECESLRAIANNATRIARADYIDKWIPGFIAARISHRYPDTRVEPEIIHAIYHLQNKRCYITDAQLWVPPRTHNGKNWREWSMSGDTVDQLRTIEPVRLYNNRPWEAGNIVVITKAAADLCELFGGAAGAKTVLGSSGSRYVDLSSEMICGYIEDKKQEWEDSKEDT